MLRLNVVVLHSPTASDRLLPSSDDEPLESVGVLGPSKPVKCHTTSWFRTTYLRVSTITSNAPKRTAARACIPATRGPIETTLIECRPSRAAQLLARSANTAWLV